MRYKISSLTPSMNNDLIDILYDNRHQLHSPEEAYNKKISHNTILPRRDSSASDEYSEEFTFDLPSEAFSHNAASFNFSNNETICVHDQHSALFKYLRVASPSASNHASLFNTFSILIALADPHTQPDSQNISLNLAADCLVALAFNFYAETPTAHFDCALDIAVIVLAILEKLHCRDPELLAKVDNSAEKWKKSLDVWLPHKTLTFKGFHRLDVMYSALCVGLLAIYKLFRYNDNLGLNPFLGLFVRVWKCQTKIVFFGLEIDRRAETLLETYPEVIRHVTRGSSAVRYVVAAVLNNDLSARSHDFEHEPLQGFMSPWGRRAGSGALVADMRLYVAAMLALGSDLREVTDLLADIQPDDRYDEDLRYMFDSESGDATCGCEFEESDDEACQCDLFEQEHPAHYENESLRLIDNIYEIISADPRTAKEEVVLRISRAEFESERNLNREPTVIDVHNAEPPPRISSTRAFFSEDDDSGKDWRDIPREDNMIFSQVFLENPLLKNGDLKSWLRLKTTLSTMASESVHDDVAFEAVLAVALAVKTELDTYLALAEGTVPPDVSNDPDLADPDKVYSFITTPGVFSSMSTYNPNAAFSILDELLMTHGYRRVLIWFLTHLDPNLWLVNYIYELLTGGRGQLDPAEQKRLGRFPFSRCGHLVLTELERSMLLHEFFSNSAVFLSRVCGGDAEDDIDDSCILSPSAAKNMMKVVCMMIRALEAKGVFSLTDPEHKVELQTLLIPWVGTLSQARDLFFKTNNKSVSDPVEAFSEVESQLNAKPQDLLRGEDLNFSKEQLQKTLILKDFYQQDAFSPQQMNWAGKALQGIMLGQIRLSDRELIAFLVELISAVKLAPREAAMNFIMNEDTTVLSLVLYIISSFPNYERAIMRLREGREYEEEATAHATECLNLLGVDVSKLKEETKAHGHTIYMEEARRSIQRLRSMGFDMNKFDQVFKQQNGNPDTAALEMFKEIEGFLLNVQSDGETSKTDDSKSKKGKKKKKSKKKIDDTFPAPGDSCLHM